MPVSHVGLTVSQLPVSTSFFLEALAPLGYRYIERRDNHIAFGIDNKPDFFICEKSPTTPPGPAHVAFSASCPEAVVSFFHAALKAGGKIHGEPAVRDSKTGYYSAAVIDFDNNSIEAVHRPSRYIEDNFASGGSVVRYQPAGSVVSRNPTEVRSVARSAARSVTMPPPAAPQPVREVCRSSDDMTAKTLIGAVVGAAAGALFAYAAMKGDQPSPTSHSVQPPPSEVHRSTEKSAATSLIELITSPHYVIQPRSQSGSTVSQNNQQPSYYPRAIEAPPPASTPRSHNPWVETVVNPSVVSRHTEQRAYSSRPSLVHSHHTMPELTPEATRPTIPRSSTSSSPRTVIQADYPPARSTHKSHRSSTSAHDKDERRSTSGRSHQSSHRLENITVIDQPSGPIVEEVNEDDNDIDTVAPSDSISQADTRRSKNKHRRRRSDRREGADGEKRTVVSLPIKGSGRDGGGQERDRGGIRSVVSQILTR